MSSDEIAHLLQVLSATPRPSSRSLPLPEGRENFRGMFLTVAPGGPPGVIVEPDATLGTDSNIKVRIYRPSCDSAERQPSVYAHGGGWVFGDLDTHDGLCRTLAKNSGDIIVSVAYRPAPEATFPAPVDDVVEAAKWAVKELGAAGINCILGDSAGGLLATLAAQRLIAEGIQVAGQVLICPALDPKLDTPSVREFADDPFLSSEEMRWYWQQLLPAAFPQDELPRRLLAWPHGIPSTLILTAERDILRDEAEKFAQRLRDQGGVVICRRFPSMVHGFPVMAGELPSGADTLTEIGVWMKGIESDQGMLRTFVGGEAIV